MPYLAMMAALAILGLAIGGPQTAALAEGPSGQVQLADDDDDGNRGSPDFENGYRGGTASPDVDDDNNFYDDDQGDSAHGMPPDDDDDGSDDGDDSINA